MNHIQEFNKSFNQYIWSNEVLKLIPDFGWMDGGCRSLMGALLIWLGEENATPYQITKTEDEQHSEHAVIKLGNYFLDANGLSTYEELEKYWLEEGLKAVYIKPFNPKTEPNSSDDEAPTYISEEDINKLARMIGEKFNKDVLLSYVADK